MDTADDYLRLAFWKLADADECDVAESLLRRMADDLQALAEDAFAYYLLHGEAPLLAERSEEDE